MTRAERAVPARGRRGGSSLHRRRGARSVSRGAVPVAALMLAGCGFGGLQDMPLPGGADLGGHPFKVTAQFSNVRDLVPHSSVKVNDVTVGRVSKVTLPLDSWTANVTMLINGRVRLPANAVARLEQSSLLGEKYIQLASPTAQTASGSLTDGATIPASRTNRDVEVEEVFGALSMLLNGGGLPQLRTITRELNNTLSGNEPEIRSFLRRLSTLTGTLNSGRQDIIDAIDGLNRLSSILRGRKREITVVLDDIAPGLKVIERQRGSLVTMLRQLERLADISVDLIKRTRANTVADLRALNPILRKLADSGRNLPRSLEVLLTYPFTDEVSKAIKGDYLNVYLSVTALDGTTIIPPISPSQGSGSGGAAGAGRADGAAVQRGSPGGPPLPLPTVDDTASGSGSPSPSGSPPGGPPTAAPGSAGPSGAPGSAGPSGGGN